MVGDVKEGVEGRSIIRAIDRRIPYIFPEYHLGTQPLPDLGKMVKKEPCTKFTLRRGGTSEPSRSSLVGGKIVTAVCRTE